MPAMILGSRGVVPGGGRGAMVHPDFDRSVNPSYAHLITNGTPGF